MAGCTRHRNAVLSYKKVYLLSQTMKDSFLGTMDISGLSHPASHPFFTGWEHGSTHLS